MSDPMRSEPIARNESPSEELARLLDEAEASGLRAAAFDDLRRIARLYRGQSARLARLRDRGDDRDRIAHLNALCVRAHGLLYSGAARRGRRGDTTRVPLFLEALRRTRDLRRIAWAILITGALLGFSLVQRDPDALYALMPTQLGYDVERIDALYRSPEARALFFERESKPAAANALFGSYLFSHNTRVGLLAFASGVLVGLPTLLLQLYNGMMIGTLAALFLPGEQALSFLAWILPHGIPELTAINLCCAGGLALGRAVAMPGRLRRGEALRRAGPDALALVLASLPLFFAAAWLESFVRESALGTLPRLGVAGLGGALLIGFGLLLGRRPRSRSASGEEWIDELVEPSHPRRSTRPPRLDPQPLP